MKALLCFLVCLSIGQVASAARFYVDADAASGGDGTSWATAYQYLQDALDQTVAGRDDEVWIAAGTYYADDGVSVIPGDRTMTFTLKEGVTVYGGFDGTESLVSQRDLELNESILSGEIWVDQIYWSLHVVTVAGSCVLDGLTITKGNANGDLAPFNQGGGVWADGHDLEIKNCKLFNNNASDGGGAISSSFDFSVVATSCTFFENSAGEYGGAIYASNAIVSDCTFSDNSGKSGGAIRSTTSATASNSTFSGNSARLGGAIFSDMIDSENCIFTVNYAEYLGGAILGDSLVILNGNFANNSVGSGGASSLSYGGGAIHINRITATYCTFSGNTTTYKGGAIYIYGGSNIISSVADCIFTDNNGGSDGGAIYFYDSVAPPSEVSLVRSTFTNNYASFGGGAIASSNYTVVVADSVFSNNSARSRGGAMTGSSALFNFTNCRFTDNTVDDDGGAIYVSGNPVSAFKCSFSGNVAGECGGAVYANPSNRGASLDLTNCALTNNVAGVSGGAIFTTNYGSMVISTTATNCTFIDNQLIDGNDQGRSIFSWGPVKIFNNIIWSTSEEGNLIYISSSGSIRNSDSDFPSPLDQATNLVFGGFSSFTIEEGASVSLGDTSLTIQSDDPLFVGTTALAGQDGLLGTSDDGLRLLTGSPAIDQGLSRYLPEDIYDLDDDGDTSETIPTDITGDSRIQGSSLDLGAYEGAFVTFSHLGFSDPNSDENGNGITNFGDYAAGGDPTAPDDTALRPEILGKQLSFSYRSNAADVVVQFQKSETLLPSSWQEMIEGIDYAINPAEVIQGNQTRVTFDLITTSPNIFFRTKFTESP